MARKTLIAVAAILIALFGSVGFAVADRGKLSGLLEWRYGEHTATENGSQVLNASHFTQKYSLLYSKKAKILNGRFGKYDVALGYEWSWVDSKRDNGVKVIIDNPLDKILYKGDVTVAPGGLPFNLRLYSHDLHSTRFDYEDLSEIFILPNKGIQGGSITNVQNGTYKVSGATLTAGVANGHYKGKYRDLLATMPRLLIDYRQVEVHDIKGPYKRDYVDRDLAFVSLNKKNNWFHYRVFTHEDKLDSTQNFSENTYLLGTINHRSRREWVNLTNWIQVSSDISYSEFLPNPGQRQSLRKRYEINLFTKAARTRWSGSNFTSFNRSRDDDSLDKDIYIPFFAQGELNRDTSWRFRAIGVRQQKDYFAGRYELTEDVFISGRVETFRQARYVLSPTVEIESKDGTQGRGFAGHVGAEFYSNPGFRSDFDIHGDVALRYFNGTARAGMPVDYLEATASGRIQRHLNALLLVGFNQKFVFGNGAYDNTVADNILSGGGIDTTTDRDTTFRSLTGGFAEFDTLSRLKNRVGFLVDILSASTEDGTRLGLDHELRYSGNALTLLLTNAFSTGDKLANSKAELGSTSARHHFDHRTRLTYNPSRALSNLLQASYEWFSYDSGGTLERFRVLQRSEYSIWKTAGIRRKIISFGEEFEFEKKVDNEVTVGEDFAAFTLFTDYFPTRRTLLGAKLRYDLNQTRDYDALSCFLTAGLDFEKFKVSLDYSYGTRSDGDNLPKRREQRWEIKVKKTF